ncbi:hypothetical protein E2C01_034732 [Portunus trituberculatus]|uniref:Uncharacterized protein n=1 Tax=Portunus trituberculatus TaxID=210409 RepID=A0A5B7F746_PORTR|nr:hypothetical protein [Portunus trituberculatus]
MGPRESNFGTVAGLHETVTWKRRWRSGERGSKRRIFGAFYININQPTINRQTYNIQLLPSAKKTEQCR